MHQAEVFHGNIWKLVQLRVEEQLFQSKEDSGSTFDFSKMNEVRTVCTFSVAFVDLVAMRISGENDS